MSKKNPSKKEVPKEKQQAPVETKPAQQIKENKETKVAPLEIDERVLAHDFLRFLNASPSAFHAVAATKTLLQASDFKEISERSDEDFANLKPGGRYFFSRNQSSIVAFAIGGKWVPGNGFIIQAAHTDSPVPKLKPISKLSKSGYLQVGVQLYGGGLWHTWFDRDLSVAGRVLVADGDKVRSHLVAVPRPILRIPNLAIHLDREVNTKGFAPNMENNTVPVLATAISDAANRPAPAQGADSSSSSSSSNGKNEEHHSGLLAALAEQIGVDPGAIRDVELNLFDTQPAALAGLYNEFIVARALDNLCMSYLTQRALIDSLSDGSLDSEETVRMVVLVDHEEIGSSSYVGADSNFVARVLERINGRDRFDTALRNTLLVSADMAHGVHPNYSDKHEGVHRPELQKGLVLKENCNQRYATNMVTSFFVQEVARRYNLPVQKFVVRNDSACGSTIGPLLASACGVRTVDVGVPQLSMHSVREQCGVRDLRLGLAVLTGLYLHYGTLNHTLQNTD